MPALAPALKPGELLVAWTWGVAVGSVVGVVVAAGVELVGNPVDKIVDRIVDEIALVDEDLDALADEGEAAPSEMLK